MKEVASIKMSRRFVVLNFSNLYKKVDLNNYLLRISCGNFKNILKTHTRRKTLH